jgi:GR25 family glycosyltransferase involved in LPS biosynthesis
MAMPCIVMQATLRPLVLLAFFVLLPASSAVHAANVSTFCISLPEHYARRRSLSAHFKGVLNITYVQGVRGRNASPFLATSIDVVPDTCDNYARNSPEFMGTLGCTLGHLRALVAAEEQGVDVALIIEDDVVPDLMQFWNKDLSTFITELPPNWSTVQLSLIGYPHMWASAYDSWISAGKMQVISSKAFWSTAAYMISRDTIKQMLTRYRVNDKFDLSSMPCINADIQLFKGMVRNDMFYIATPPLFTFADSEKSDIRDGANSHFGDLHEQGAAYLHTVSRLLALEWSARAWRGVHGSTHMYR